MTMTAMNAAGATSASAHALPSSRPFLKWAGGKAKLLASICALAPPDFGTYYEPFVGAGALFFRLAHRPSVIGDVNTKLITTYRALQFDPDSVIRRLRTYVNEEKFYYAIREKNFAVGPDAERAADFIFCNRVGFNGLFRENGKGQFNVPFGRNPRATLCDEDRLISVATALQEMEIRSGDFAETVRSAREGDFVYFDPPYMPISATSSFTGYSADGFSYADQVRLRDVARDLKSRGVSVVLSNSSAPVVYDLYRGDFVIHEVMAPRAISASAESRGPVKELLIK